MIKLFFRTGDGAEVAGKVNSLIGEVTAATNEQAQGVSQINEGVGQLDQVTQSNAASSEESASAGEELSAQAVELSDMVQELVVLVEGGGAVRQQNFSSAQHRPQQSGAPVKRPTSARKIQAPKSTHKAAEQMIPLDDDDFSLLNWR